jgi:GNAT superfamily N-acetyltransferase
LLIYDASDMLTDGDFSIEIEARGESVAYREGTRSTYVAISFEPAGVRLYLGAPLRWYGPHARPGALMSAEEAGRATKRVVEHLADGGSRRVIVDRTPPPTREQMVADLVARFGAFEDRPDGSRAFGGASRAHGEKRRRGGATRRTSAGVLGLLTVSLGSATFEALRSRAPFWPPLAAAAVGAGLTALLLWHASRPKTGARLPRGYDVRAARVEDLPALPGIERQAGAAFAQYLRETGMTTAAFEDVSSVDDLESAMRGGRLWVATRGDRPVAFAWVEVVAGYAHLEEVNVDPAHARRGLGAALIDIVCAWAVSNRLAAVTLTTFRDVPWNAPYYARLGFSAVDPAILSPEHVEIMRDEASRGFDPERRVMMILPLRS